jgi:hypothetical protein
MSFYRRAKKVDSSQAEIVAALRSAGVHVEIIGRPVDLLTYYRGRWLPLETKPAAEPGIRVKTRAVRRRNDQERQEAFCHTFGVPIVRTAQEALAAVRGYCVGGEG